MTAPPPEPRLRETRPYAKIGGAVVVKALNTLLNFAITILLARILGPSDYGIYAFALATVALVASPVNLGLPMLLIREIAAFEAAAAWGKIRGIIRWAALLAGTAALLGVGIGLGILGSLGDSFDGPKGQALGAALALLVLGTGIYIANGVLIGLRKIMASVVPQHILRPLLFLGLLAVFAQSGELSAIEAVLLNAVAALVALIAMVVLIRRLSPQAVSQTKAVITHRAWIKSLLPLTLLAGVEIFSNQIDIFMLGLLGTDAETGFYRVAFSGAALILLCRAVSDLVIAPQISRFWAQDDRDGLQSLIRWSARMGLFAAAPLAIALTVYGTELIGLAYGAEYHPAYPAMAILCIGQIVNAATGPVTMTLQMTGHERETIKGTIAAGIGNIVLNALLIPTYGAMGAAVATTVTLTGVNFYLLWRLRVRTGLGSAVI